MWRSSNSIVPLQQFEFVLRLRLSPTWRFLRTIDRREGLPLYKRGIRGSNRSAADDVALKRKKLPFKFGTPRQPSFLAIVTCDVTTYQTSGEKKMRGVVHVELAAM